VRALAAEPSCAEVVMVNRRTISLTADPRVRQVILDTAAAQFPAEVTKLAQSMVARGDPVHGASCVGVGKGSMKWSEEELKALEIGVVGGFCPRLSGRRYHTVFSALGSGKHRKKQDSLCAGHGVERRGGSRDRLPTPRDFSSGNYRRQCSTHRPMWLGWGGLVPGPFGTIEQDDIGRAFVAEFISSSVPNGVVHLENGAMRQLSVRLSSSLFPESGAFRAGIADRVQHLANLGRSFISGEACWQVSAGDFESPLPRMRIGTILHPTVFLAPRGLRPLPGEPGSPIRAASVSPAFVRSLVVSIEMAPDTTNLCVPSFVPAASTRLGFATGQLQSFS